MAKLLRKRFVDVVAESTYNTDPGSGRTALLPSSDLSLQVSGQTTVRDTVRDTLSPRGHVVTERMMELTLPLELRGAGTDAGLKVPETDALLKACLMQREDGSRITLTSVTGDFTRGETVTNTTAANTVGTVADWDSANNVLHIRDLQNAPSTSDSLTGDSSSAGGDVSAEAEAYVYRPASTTPDSQGSVYARFDLDGMLHKLGGARGTFSLSITRNEIPRINFTLMSKYLEPTDGGPITGTALDLTPAPALGVDLILGDLDMSLVAVNSVQMDVANDVQPRQDLQADDGFSQQIVIGRDPTGSIDPEVTTIANFNPYADWSAGNTVAVAAGIGSAAGERVRVVAPATQYTQLPYSNRNGLATYDIGFRMTGDDDELMLIYS